MKKVKSGRGVAGVVVAAGIIMGLCGCGGDKVQETLQQTPSSSVSRESVSVQEESAQEPEFEQNATLHAVDELEAYALECIKAGVLEEMGLSADLAKDAMLDYAVQEIQEDCALIRYYIETSDHSIYVVDETVSLSGKNRDYQVARESLQSYVSITDSSMFASLHKESHVSSKSTGYSTQYFRGLVRDMSADKALAERFANPVDAAVNLLHLGPGKGEVTSDIKKPSIGSDSWEKDLNKDILPEGTTVTVTYTFDKDGSVVEILMEVIESSFGIWAPAEGNWSRQVYDTFYYHLPFGDDEVENFSSIQNSTFGLYELKDGGISCIFPYYTAPDISIGRNVATDENLIYFFADSQYQEGNLEYDIDCMAMLDLATGQVDMESMKLPEEAHLDRDATIYVNVDGFMRVNSKYLPCVNVGTADFSGGVCRDGKPVSCLNEAEQNAYGSENRTKILSKPGKVMQLSLRSMTETFAYIDLDGDGITEKIVLKPENPYSDRTYEMPYDDFKLIVGDSVLEDYGVNLHNDIYAFSLDGKEILVLLYENGPSDDPLSHLYAYREGKLVKVGEMPDHIVDGDIQDGIIDGTERGDVIQSDYIRVKWQIGQDGMLEKVPQDTYDYTNLNDITLLMALPVHSEPDLKAPEREIQPQKVKFLMTDNTMTWVYVKGENGDAGWVYVEPYGHIVELKKDYDEVFEDLWMFG